MMSSLREIIGKKVTLKGGPLDGLTHVVVNLDPIPMWAYAGEYPDELVVIGHYVYDGDIQMIWRPVDSREGDNACT